MGNIDDPNSEAYKQFGAGRGRNAVERDESISVNELMAVARPSMKPNPIFAAGDQQGKRQPSGDASVAEEYANRPRNPEAEQEADNPRKTASNPTATSAKPTVRNKVTAPSLGNDDYSPSTSKVSTKPSIGNDDYGPSAPKESKVSTPSAVKPKPAVETPAKTSRVPTSEQASANRAAAFEKVKGMGSSIANYFSNYETPAERKAKERKEKAAKGSYSSGGSVSSASKRADGIATKGKTRGKMC
jgi:hypothetical protein